MSTFASSSDERSSDALARCAAFQREAAIEGAAAAIEDGAGASGAAHDLFVERFVAFAVLQERHRAGRLLAGDAAAAAAAPAAAAVPPAAPRRARRAAPVFFEPRAEALYRSMPPDRFEAPLETRRRGRSYRVVRTDASARAAAALDLAALRRRHGRRAPKPKPYWNVHADEFNVESYEHTALLYLSDDFEGGRFAMYDGDGGDRVHAPRAGDVLAFSGDAWDDALRSAAEVSLAAQDPRRSASATPTPPPPRLAGPDVRLDVSDARVRYDGPAPAAAGPADATLAALAAAADDDDAPPRRASARSAKPRRANDFLEVAKNDGIVSEEEVAAKREAAQEEEVAPKEYDPDASRFGNWFDVLRK
ncbi:hypothetical protein JL720_6605 [Aureococcus anophagefferens]|nr:hypothetical protein JL720_6605 [Aureococcus anophagefferens]